LSHSYQYNSANQRVQATREDNTSWRYGYDPLGQVTSAQKRLADGATPALGLDYAYTYDDIGNRLSQIANTQLSNYTSNSLNQYAQRTVPGNIPVLGAAAADATVTVNGQTAPRQGETYYTNVPFDNTTRPFWAQIDIAATRAGATAVATRYTWLPKNPEVFTHDADGNLAVDGRWTYSWDAENRLIAMETRPDILPPAGSFPLQQRRRLEFAYDVQGRRVSKKVSNWTAGGWLLVKQTAFVYDGWNLLADLNFNSSTSTWSAARSYTWGLDLSGSQQGAGGVGGLLTTTLNSEPGTPNYFAAYDGNGNVTGLVDATTGALAGKYDYTAFGETVLIDGTSAEVNPFRFSTKYTDTETGLCYYGLRYYNPGTARWLSRDPLDENGGLNLYGFCANNPVDLTDRNGLDFATWVGAGPSYSNWNPANPNIPNIYAPPPQWVQSFINWVANGPDGYAHGENGIARQLLARYMSGNTSPWNLSTADFADIVGSINLRAKPAFTQKVASQSQGCSNVSNLGVEHYARKGHTLGRMILILDGNLCKCGDTWSFEGTVKVSDRYDFDTHWMAALKTTFLGTPGGRQLGAEVQTQLGAWLPGKEEGFLVNGGPESIKQKSTEAEATWAGSGKSSVDMPEEF